MENLKVFESEYKFLCILWENEPIGSMALVKLCKEQLEWSKATTYTVIRRLCQRGIIKNEDAVVTPLITKEQAQLSDFDELLEKRFDGSLPAFFATFTKQRALSDAEIAEIISIITDKKKEEQ